MIDIDETINWLFSLDENNGEEYNFDEMKEITEDEINKLFDCS